MKLSWLLSSLASVVAVVAQDFVPFPKNVKTTLSEKFPGAKITYKRVNNFCETTPKVRSFSGHITLPKTLIPDAEGWENGSSGSLHFWYFEARNNPTTAPTSIYFGGGPGYSGFDGSAVFPCYFNAEGNSTTLNKHSWNNHVNMLYIDQPFGVGFSYTNLHNGTFHTLDSSFTPLSDDADHPELNLTTIQGTLSPVTPETATNTTKSAARTFWRAAQVWFNEFPERSTNNDEISMWAVSYGGLYAPIFSSYFLDQNRLIRQGKHKLVNATVMNMATVGVVNGLLELRSMAPGFPDFARNNTYGLPTYSEDVYTAVVKNITAPDDGCLALIDQCKNSAAKDDPDGKGGNKDVNEICSNATQACFNTIFTSYGENSPYGVFDITINRPAAFPYEYEAAVLNQPWVLAELGMPLNYTRGSQAIEAAFRLTGDTARYDLSHVTNLLENGVALVMANGDRDYRCNWISGEAASLSIPFRSATGFAKAGYEPLITNSSYQGGLVREHGNLSFSRVFQAGHSAGGYQPETMSVIFERAIFRKDIATGKVDLSKTPGYHSKGLANIRDIKSELPEPIENVCYVLAPSDTCTEEQIKALADGSAETANFLVTKPTGTKGERLNKSEIYKGGNSTSGRGGDTKGDSHGGDGSSSAAVLRSSFIVASLSVCAMVVMW